MQGHLYGTLASPEPDHALILIWPEEEFGAQEASGCSSPTWGEGVTEPLLKFLNFC